MVKDNSRKLLSDEELEKVVGGMDAKTFAKAILDKVSGLGHEGFKYRPIVDAIKAKNYIEVCNLAIPMLYEGDPIIMEAYNISK